MDGIMNGMVLKDDECLVALDDGGEGWIIARSEHIHNHDILIECATSDNGFNGKWCQGLPVGIYKCRIKPWGHGPDLQGEYDCGIDVMEVTQLWSAAA